MVVTQHPAAAGQGVLVEIAGLLMLTQITQFGREPAGRGEGVGMVVTEFVAPDTVGAFERRHRGLRLASGQQVRRSAIE